MQGIMGHGGSRPIRAGNLLGQPKPNPLPLGYLFLSSSISLARSLRLPLPCCTVAWLRLYSSIKSASFSAASLWLRNTGRVRSGGVEPIRPARRNFSISFQKVFAESRAALKCWCDGLSRLKVIELVGFFFSCQEYIEHYRNLCMCAGCRKVTYRTSVALTAVLPCVRSQKRWVCIQTWRFLSM